MGNALQPAFFVKKSRVEVVIFEVHRPSFYRLSGFHQHKNLLQFDCVFWSEALFLD
jgi:hypothetical protein